jgi:ferrochelatase
MRYWSPRAEDTLRQMARDGVEQAVVLSMYPHYTGATTGSSVNDFRRAAARVHPQLRYRLVESWYDWPGYLAALAGRVRAGLEGFHELVRDEVQILFSAHALPQKFIDRGDPYLDQVLTTVRGVMAEFPGRPWHLGFQSRSGPVEWMAPDTLEVMDQLAAEGQGSVLIVPISFVSDHIETLFEIDVEYRDHAQSCGLRNFARAPSLNVDPAFVRALADLVRSGEAS